MSWILNWLLKRVTFRLYNSSTPNGKRLGGHDIPNVIDSYIILELVIAKVSAFTGYFQTF
jgi:hypothetical protein